MPVPEFWPLDRVRNLDWGETVVWASHAVPAGEVFPEERLQTGGFPEGMRQLLVVGGGSLIDHAKFECAARKLRLIAIPSIWGSGAENTPIVVLDKDGRKSFQVGEKFFPHARSIWPELANTVSERRRMAGCGDCWTHALEGFLSPVASEGLRLEMAELIRTLIDTTLGAGDEWFQLSATAAEAQSRSSVGLVHGIAHQLEPLLEGWGHARLCALFLYPVMRFNFERSADVVRKFAAYGLEESRILALAKQLFDADAFAELLPVLEKSWASVLRDPSSRTNPVLVRKGDFSDLARLVA